MRKTHIARRNQWFQRVVTVQTNRNKRWRERLFLVEGVRAISLLADQNRWEVAALLYDERSKRSEWADQVIATLACGEHLVFSEALFEQISERDEGSELLALVRIPDSVTGLPDVDGSELVLLLDRPMNPGNLGSIVRSCDALECSKLIVFGHAADPFDPVAVRATTGSLFSVDLFGLQCSRNDLAGWFEQFTDAGGRLLGTSARATTPIWSAIFRGPSC